MESVNAIIALEFGLAALIKRLRGRLVPFGMEVHTGLARTGILNGIFATPWHTA
jgi:hypothetical protein